VQALLQAGWIALLAVPVGFWARRRVETVIALVALGAGLVAIPRLVGLLATPPIQIVAAALGAVLGGGIRRVLAVSVTRGAPT
jgi:hypothetical protein